jgi:hypothetical protein
MERESQADATDEGALMVPGHVGNICLICQKEGPLVNTETVGHSNRGGSIKIEERH